MRGKARDFAVAHAKRRSPAKAAAEMAAAEPEAKPAVSDEEWNASVEKLIDVSSDPNDPTKDQTKDPKTKNPGRVLEAIEPHLAAMVEDKAPAAAKTLPPAEPIDDQSSMDDMEDIDQAPRPSDGYKTKSDTDKSDLLNPMKIDKLAGALRDRMMRQIAGLGKGWNNMLHHEQLVISDQVLKIGMETIREMCSLVVSTEFPQITVDLGKIAIDADIRGTFKTPLDGETLAYLTGRLHKKAVLILMAPEAYFGTDGESPDVKLDQASLVDD